MKPLNQVHGKRCDVTASRENDTLFVGNICKTWSQELVIYSSMIYPFFLSLFEECGIRLCCGLVWQWLALFTEEILVVLKIFPSCLRRTTYLAAKLLLENKIHSVAWKNIPRKKYISLLILTGIVRYLYLVMKFFSWDYNLLCVKCMSANFYFSVNYSLKTN